MKKLFVLSLGLVFAVASGGISHAEKTVESMVKSGPKDGAKLGAFTVTKVAGAEDDGVAEGKKLCYRCKNSSRPQVVIFTRSTDANVAQLLTKIDEALAKHESDELRCFVNVMAEDRDEATETAKKFAMQSKTKHIPFVVPNEFENGPDNYGLNPDAEVTVTLATDGKVVSSHGFASGQAVNIQAVMDGLEKLVH